MDLYLVWRKTLVHIVWNISWTTSSLSFCSQLSSTYICCFFFKISWLDPWWQLNSYGKSWAMRPVVKTLILLIISDIIWYKSNQYTNTTIRLFLSANICLVVYLLYLPEFSIFNSLSYARDVFWPILVSLARASYLLCCLLSDDVIALKLSNNIVSVFIQDKLYMICIILRLVICLIYNFVM